MAMTKIGKWEHYSCSGPYPGCYTHMLDFFGSIKTTSQHSTPIETWSLVCCGFYVSIKASLLLVKRGHLFGVTLIDTLTKTILNNLHVYRNNLFTPTGNNCCKPLVINTFLLQGHFRHYCILLAAVLQKRAPVTPAMLASADLVPIIASCATTKSPPSPPSPPASLGSHSPLLTSMQILGRCKMKIPVRSVSMVTTTSSGRPPCSD